MNRAGSVFGSENPGTKISDRTVLDRGKNKMKYLDWYLKISVFGAMVGGSMELFMIKTGFYDKVTVLEAEKRAWETSPEALAVREALNPWKNQDKEETKNS